MRKILLFLFIGFLAVQAPVFAQDVNGRGAIETVDPAAIEISVAGNRIVYSNAPLGKMEIYSVVGQKVAVFDIKSSSGECIIDVPKGYYIIKLGKIVRKVAIRN